MIGLSYKNEIPDFSAFSKGTVEIYNMQGAIDGRSSNFSKAYKELSKQLNISVPDLKKMVQSQRLTWHECNDMKTMQLITTQINSNFGHVGGVGEINPYFDLLEGKFN